MSIIEFENGTRVEFDGVPTQADVEEVASGLGLKPSAPERPVAPVGGLQETLGKRQEALTQARQATMRGEQTLPEEGLQAVGQIAGAATDIGAAAVGGIARFGGRVLSALTPDVIEKPITEAVTGAGVMFLQSPVGKKAIEASSQGIDAYQQWKIKNPRAARNFEAVVDIATLIPIGAGAKAGVKTTIKTVKPFAEPLIKATLREQAKRAVMGLDETIRKNFTKAIRPSVTGTRTAGQTEQYFKNASDAVKTIVENKSNLKYIDEAGEEIIGTPKNLKQFTEAIEQSKKAIFVQYNDLAKKTGEKGVLVNLHQIAYELEKVGSSITLKDNAPDVAQYALKRSESLRSRSFYTATQAEEAIKIYNQSLDAFYRSPSYESASKATIDAMIVNNMRKKLDDTIENAISPGYAGLKKQYGSLKSIEKDVNRRAIVDARKNVKGLVDFTDVFSGGQVINGILSLNPVQIASGATQRGIKDIYKYLNDPNSIIKNMFSDVEKAYLKAERQNIPVR